jgi:hypothetical protein
LITTGTALENVPPVGVTVIVDVPVAVCPAMVVTVAKVPLTVNVPVLLPPFTVKVTPLEVPPPGVGLNTVTAGVPAAAMSPAGTVTWSCEELKKVGVSAALAPNFTVAPSMKLVPFTVSVKAAPPAALLVGEIVVTAGTGFEPVIVKLNAAELLELKLASPL